MENKKLIPLIILAFVVQCCFILYSAWFCIEEPTLVVITANGEEFEFRKSYVEKDEICFIILPSKQFHCLEYAAVKELKTKPGTWNIKKAVTQWNTDLLQL